MSKITHGFISVFVLIATVTYSQTHAGRLSANDIAKIKALNEAYVAALLN